MILVAIANVIAQYSNQICTDLIPYIYSLLVQSPAHGGGYMPWELMHRHFISLATHQNEPWPEQ